MNLEQLLKFDNIEDYYILWYGANISDDYIDDQGLLKETIEMNRCTPKDDTVYIILSGIDKEKSRYRLAVKLHQTAEEGIYRWVKVNIQLDYYANRLVLRKNSGFSFYNNSTSAKDFIVEEIWGKEEERTVPQFMDYDSLELSFANLQEVIEGHYSDYYKALSSVKGIYMIIDGNDGKLYVGSAYGQDGIWGRWASYAESYHGDNSKLKSLYDKYGEEYFHNFKYIVLEIFPKKISAKEIIEKEQKYKNRFLTKEFGLNAN